MKYITELIENEKLEKVIYLYRGVTKDKMRDRWVAYINKKIIYLGNFDELKDATKASKKAEI